MGLQISHILRTLSLRAMFRTFGGHYRLTGVGELQPPAFHKTSNPHFSGGRDAQRPGSWSWRIEIPDRYVLQEGPGSVATRSLQIWVTALTETSAGGACILRSDQDSEPQYNRATDGPDRFARRRQTVA